jgi:hypothetical protein
MYRYDRGEIERGIHFLAEQYPKSFFVDPALKTATEEDYHQRSGKEWGHAPT